MAAEKRKVKKWGWKTLLALLGLAAAGAFGFFSIFNTVRVAAAKPALSENEANEAASVTITDAELEQLLSGELTLDSLTRTGTDEAPAASEAQGIAAGEQPARTESEAAASSEPEGMIVKSPLVGTFYAAPSEDADPFVSVGDQVKKGQTLAIVEAMKLMNEIESDFDGKVAEIYVQNGQAVEYGQPLFRIV